MSEKRKTNRYFYTYDPEKLLWEDLTTTCQQKAICLVLDRQFQLFMWQKYRYESDHFYDGASQNDCRACFQDDS